MLENVFFYFRTIKANVVFDIKRESLFRPGFEMQKQ
jgi:hypothetical protein